MVAQDGKAIKCVSIAIVLSFLMTSLVPVADGAGWGRSTTVKTGLLLSQIGVGDVDRDGVDELYAASLKGRILKVQEVSSQWGSTEVSTTPDSVQDMLVGDINKDGYEEIYISAGHSTDNGRLYRVSYNGAAWNNEIMYSSFGQSDYPMGMTMGDVDKDGNRDIYWLEAGGAIRYIYYDAGISTWSVRTIDTRPAGYLRSITVGDADMDGNSEVYVGTDDNKILMYKYSGATWQSAIIYNAGFDSYWDYVRDLIIGDPDHDDKTEIAFIAGDQSLMLVGYDIFQGTWSGEVIYYTEETQSVTKLAIGDGDADGEDDLFGSGTDNSIYHFPWYADLQQWGRTEISMGSLPNEVHDLIVTEVDGEPDYQEIYATCEDGIIYRFSRDVDPPVAPTIWSDTHPEMVWRNITKVVVNWKMTDGDPSGIVGFSYEWSDSPTPTPPAKAINIGPTRDSLEASFGDSKTIYFGIRAVDGAGNWGPIGWYGPIFIDATPPDYAKVSIEMDAKFTKSAYSNLQIDSKDAFSGLANMSFSNDGKHWSDWYTYDGTYTAWDLNQYSPGGITDGIRTVRVRAQDLAGNIRVGEPSEIILDQTSPRGLEVSINGGERYTRSTDVDLAVSWDPATEGSPITAMSFSNDNNLWSPWENLAISKAKWSLVNDPGGWDRDGEHKVYFRIRDEAGNIGGPTYAPVVLDRTPPYAMTITVNNGDLVSKNRTVPLTLKAEDKPEHSGLGYMSFREEGGSWTDWVPWTSKTNFMLSANEGTKMIYYRTKDKAGNEAEPVRGFVVYDTASPRISHVRVLGISDKGAVVTWLTDIPANGLVRYGTTVNYNSVQSHVDLSTAHSVTLSGLRPLTEYHLRVESTDQPGVSPTMSRDYFFTTKEATDSIPPTITDLTVEGVTTSTAVISWKTDEPADTRLRYGLTTQYDFVDGDSKDRLNHLVVLRGLEAGKTYNFLAQSSDNRGNGPTDTAGTFTTSTVSDTEAPTISSLQIIGITDTLAIVTWNTNEPTLGIIEYGTTNAYGSIAVTERYEKVHRVVLMGLKPDTMYYLVVRAIDVSGNGPTTSDDEGFFTMKAADRSPPMISNVRVEAVEATTAIVSWATDEPSDSAVDYHSVSGIGQMVYDLDMVETHSIALGGLTPATEYHFTVQSMDISGNGPSTSTEVIFKTGTNTDTDAPNIFNVSVVGISNQVAVVLWDTDKQAKCTVKYGKATKNYMFEMKEEGYFQEHTLVLWSLVPDTSYFLQVQCTDPAGNGPTLSDEVNFRTSNLPDKDPPEIMDLKVRNITTSSVIIEWRTEEPADSEVRFGKGEAQDLVASDERFVFNHILALQNLQPNTTYTFTPFSNDPSGNEGSGQKLTFKTNSIYVPPHKPPPRPDPDDGGGTAIQNAMPWIALAIVLMLVVALAGFMYRQGLLKVSEGTTGASQTRPSTSSTSAQASPAPVVPLASDEGLCPHCKGHISLSAAATELQTKREKEEELRRQQEASERQRQAVAEAHRKKMAERERRIGTMAGGMTKNYPATATDAAAPTSIRVVGENYEGADPGQEVPDDELAELYQEVETEKTGMSDRASAADMSTSSYKHHSHAKTAKPAIAVAAQAGKKTPLKTVKCGHCEGRVPVYTEKRPVRITCPSCGKSGTLKGN